MQVSFEVFTAVTMKKNVVFWDVSLCRSWVNRHFGGTYRLHIQGRKIREREPASAASCSLFYNILPPAETSQVVYSYEIFWLNVRILISPIRVTCFAHLILYNVTTLLILDAKWAGYVARIGKKRNVCRVVVGRIEGKRPLGWTRRSQLWKRHREKVGRGGRWSGWQRTEVDGQASWKPFALT
jgi:hypothetical protein